MKYWRSGATTLKYRDAPKPQSPKAPKPQSLFRVYMKSDMSSGVAEAAAAAAPFEEPFEEPPEENPEKNPNELPAASPEEGLSGGSPSALGAPRHLEPHPHPAPLEVGAGVATTSVALVFWASRYFSVVAPLLQYFILCHTPSKQKDENALSPGDKQQQVAQTPGLCFLHGACHPQYIREIPKAYIE